MEYSRSKGKYSKRNSKVIPVPGVGELGDIAVVARLHQARRPKDKRQRTTVLRVL